MKIILSRKGFDSANGKCPNPIFPDGTMLSLPIPSKDALDYDDIIYRGKTYKQLLKELNPKMKYHHCHLDPDIRADVRKHPVADWKPAFGQTNLSQKYLMNAGVEEGDLFLFFGRFQEVEKDTEGKWRFAQKSPIKHIVYGYLQIGEILLTEEKISKYYWHPHSFFDSENEKNALYIPKNKLTFCEEKAGYGTWNHKEELVLTMDGQNTATWKNYPFLEPRNIVGNRKNSAGNEGIYYGGIWQELVIKENEAATEWALGLFC